MPLFYLGDLTVVFRKYWRSLNGFPKGLKQKRVLFHRDYVRFQGGHLKLWHYFNHLQSTQIYSPEIYFTPNSIHDANNPWNSTLKNTKWLPATADILFLAGLDWQAVLTNQDFLKKKASIPVINLIQGLSHADPNDVKYKFLSEKAIRICVSPEVAEAIQATGQVNGPIFTLPNAVDLSSTPEPLAVQKKDIELLIVAIKKPSLGLALEQELLKQNNAHNISTITELLPRSDFLQLLNRAQTVVFLPHFAEGFYLPALEAMALGSLVICPDCIGNRSFCIAGQTCFFPVYEVPAILSAIHQASLLDTSQRASLLEQARLQVDLHSLEHERKQFLAIMDNLSMLW